MNQTKTLARLGECTQTAKVKKNRNVASVDDCSVSKLISAAHVLKLTHSSGQVTQVALELSSHAHGRRGDKEPNQRSRELARGRRLRARLTSCSTFCLRRLKQSISRFIDHFIFGSLE